MLSDKILKNETKPYQLCEEETKIAMKPPISQDLWFQGPWNNFV